MWAHTSKLYTSMNLMGFFLFLTSCIFEEGYGLLIHHLNLFRQGQCHMSRVHDLLDNVSHWFGPFIYLMLPSPSVKVVNHFEWFLYKNSFFSKRNVQKNHL